MSVTMGPWRFREMCSGCGSRAVSFPIRCRALLCAACARPSAAETKTPYPRSSVPPASSQAPQRETEPLPTEVYEPELLAAIIAVRCDRSTRGQARALFAREWDVPFPAVRIAKVNYDHDREYAAEMAADGIPEPYDGWPLRQCGPGEGAAYWGFVDWMDYA